MEATPQQAARGGHLSHPSPPPSPARGLRRPGPLRLTRSVAHRGVRARVRPPADRRSHRGPVPYAHASEARRRRARNRTFGTSDRASVRGSIMIHDAAAVTSLLTAVRARGYCPPSQAGATRTRRTGMRRVLRPRLPLSSVGACRCLPVLAFERHRVSLSQAHCRSSGDAAGAQCQ